MTNSINRVWQLWMAGNRISTPRLSDQPVCGKCKLRLFEANPLELTKDSFDRNLNRNEIPLVVDFWAPWCGPCQMMAPAFKQAASELEPHVRFAKLNTEAEPEIAGRLGIRSIPTMILFSAGKEIQRQSGAIAAQGIIDWVRPLIQQVA